MDGNAILYGYLTQGELDFATHEEGLLKDGEAVDLQEEIMSKLVDRTPLKISAKAPMEYAVEMFGKLGLWHLVVVEEGTGKVVRVIIQSNWCCIWRDYIIDAAMHVQIV